MEESTEQSGPALDSGHGGAYAHGRGLLARMGPTLATGPGLRYLLLLAVAVTIVGFLVDVSYTIKDGAADFRPRVTGYRLMVGGHDPYRFLWQPGMPAKFVDPYLPSHQSLTRTTVTPTALLLNAPLDALTYKQQKLAWLFVQWALFLGMLYMLGRCMIVGDRLVFWIVGLLLVGGSYAWRGHVERGQIYVVFAFLFACVIALALSHRSRATMVAGVLLGLLIALRPSYALVLIPFVMAVRWRFVLATALGLVVSVAVPAALFGVSIWQEYARAMAAQARLYLRWFDSVPQTASWYPKVIDGMHPADWNAVSLPGFDSSFANLANIAHVALASTAIYVCLLVTVTAYMVLLWLAGRGRRPRTGVLLLEGGMLVALAEFFLIATKYSYRDVTLTPLVALVVINLGVPWLQRSRWTYVGLFGLALGCVSVAWRPGLPGHMVLAGELILILALLALTLSAASGHQQSSGPPEDEAAHHAVADASATGSETW
jgi:hypothetical protein